MQFGTKVEENPSPTLHRVKDNRAILKLKIIIFYDPRCLERYFPFGPKQRLDGRALIASQVRGSQFVYFSPNSRSNRKWSRGCGDSEENVSPTCLENKIMQGEKYSQKAYSAVI